MRPVPVRLIHQYSLIDTKCFQRSEFQNLPKNTQPRSEPCQSNQLFGNEVLGINNQACYFRNFFPIKKVIMATSKNIRNPGNTSHHGSSTPPKGQKPEQRINSRIKPYAISRNRKRVIMEAI